MVVSREVFLADGYIDGPNKLLLPYSAKTFNIC